jgi:hypothetical protein
MRHRSSFTAIWWTVILLVTAFLLVRVSPAIAEYLGPDRTVTETVQESEGWGRECQLVGGQYRWVTTLTCNGCSASCVTRLDDQYPDHNPASICNAAYLGSRVHHHACTTSEIETSYQPATISASLACAQPGSAGWCRSAAVVQLLANEGADACGRYALTRIEDNLGSSLPVSGCSAEASVTIAANGTTSYLAWVHSSLGDTSEMAGLTVLVDQEPPSLSYDQPDLFTLALSASDAHSGVEYFEVDLNNRGWVPGAVHTLAPGLNEVRMRVFDRAGNQTELQAVIVTDADPPETLTDRIEPAAPDGGHGWYRTTPTITVTAADAHSGIAFAGLVLDGVDYPADSGYLVGSGVHAIRVKAVDGAGNQRLEAPVSFANPLMVDPDPPALAVAISPAPAVSGWHDQPVVVEAGDTRDDLSGLALLEISLDGGAFQPGPQITVLEGQHTVTVRAADLAGNQAEADYAVQVDLFPPTASLTLTGERGPAVDQTWYRSPVQVQAEAADASGGPVTLTLAHNGVPAGNPLELAAEGWHQVEASATDVVGRQAAASAAFGIDLTLPSAAISSHQDGTVVRADFVLSGTAFDDLSGIYQLQLQVGAGEWVTQTVDAAPGEAAWSFPVAITDLPAGPLTLRLRALDRAGNFSPEQTVSVRVSRQPARLEIPDRWWAGETVIPRHVPGDAGGVVRAVAVVSHPRIGSVTLLLRPADQWALRWDGTIEDGQAWAPPGEYRVVVTAFDQYGSAAIDKGIIVVHELPDLPPVPARQRFPIAGLVSAFDAGQVVVDGTAYTVTADARIEPGVAPGQPAYGEAEQFAGQQGEPAQIVWLKPAEEVPIAGLVESLAADHLVVAGQRFELTAFSRLPAGLASGLQVVGLGLLSGGSHPETLWLELVAPKPVPAQDAPQEPAVVLAVPMDQAVAQPTPRAAGSARARVLAFSLLGLGMAGLLAWLLAGQRYRGTLVAVDGEARVITLRRDGEEQGRAYRLGYHRRLADTVPLHHGCRVCGRIVLFRAWSMQRVGRE